MNFALLTAAMLLLPLVPQGPETPPPGWGRGQAASPRLAGTGDSNMAPRFVVENYIESIYMYCKKYDATHRFHIENQLLTDPNVRIGNDIAGMADKNGQANVYYIDLKKQGVVVEYKPGFELVDCTVKGKKYTACLLQKKLRYRNGLSEQFGELVELEDQGGGNWRIRSISSTLFYNLADFNCRSAEAGGNKAAATAGQGSCALLDRAEAEYAGKNFGEALQLYVAALDCAADKQHVEQRIWELKTLGNLKALLGKGEQEYRAQAYGQALSTYQSILENGAGLLSEEERRLVEARVIDCAKLAESRQLQEDADHYFSRGAYLNALPLYEAALALVPGDAGLERRLAECRRSAEQENEQKIKATIARGTQLVEAGKLDEGFSILLQHRESGLLGVEQLFYMAQILDNRPKPVKAKFDLSNTDCCILTRQFMIEARNLGASSEDFEFFWEAHFNKTSQSCVN
jgi:tetratricopeptide (TPR) repeat protein